MRRNILAFGDSNTWGWNPANDLIKKTFRWPDDIRWTGVAQKILGSNYHIINHGLNGRTTVWDDPIEPYRCGIDQLIPALDTAAPIDLCIIFVGSNDLKARYSVTAQDIALSAGRLIDRALHEERAFGDGGPKVLLVAPTPLGPIENGVFSEMFKGSVEKSKALAPYYKAIANTFGVPYFDAGSVVHASNEDGLHLQADQHNLLGIALAKEIKRILD